MLVTPFPRRGRHLDPVVRERCVTNFLGPGGSVPRRDRGLDHQPRCRARRSSAGSPPRQAQLWVACPREASPALEVGDGKDDGIYNRHRPCAAPRADRAPYRIALRA
jgi:hypothetical protein